MRYETIKDIHERFLNGVDGDHSFQVLGMQVGIIDDPDTPAAHKVTAVGFDLGDGAWAVAHLTPALLDSLVEQLSDARRRVVAL